MTTRTKKHRFISSKIVCKKVTLQVAEMDYLLTNWNKRNRDKKNMIVSRYINEMENGKWLTADEGGTSEIIFSKSGMIQDGQHRLEAAVSLNKPLNTWVKYGIPQKNVKYIDSGKMRTMSERIVASHGHSLGKCGAQKRMDKYVRISRAMIKAENNFGQIPLEHNDIDALEKFIMKYKDTLDKIYRDRYPGKLGRAGFLAACAHYIMRDKEKGVEFFEKVVGDGAGLESESPTLTMRNYLLEAKSGIQNMRRTQAEDYRKAVFLIHKHRNDQRATRIRQKAEWDF